MRKRNKGISLFVIVLILAGITTAFVTVHGAQTFAGTVIDARGSLSGAYVVLSDSLWNILGADYTDSNGDYSFSATLNGYSPYLLTASKTRYIADSDEVTTGGTDYDYTLAADAKKLAYLFYAEDATDRGIIEEYEAILEDELFEVEIIANCNDVEDKCEDIDDYEIWADTIFVYVCGHGIHQDGHSLTYFSNDAGSDYTHSDDFRDWMDEWEAEKKCILVDSCYAGDWADDFANSPYLAMASSDESHTAYRMTYKDRNPWETEANFSKYFFQRVDAGYSAVQSFNYAAGFMDGIEDPCPQYPKKQDYSSYTWFN
jgi:hypothetical protein